MGMCFTSLGCGVSGESACEGMEGTDAHFGVVCVCRSGWGDCEDVDGGQEKTRTRRRSCNRPAPNCAGADCEGRPVESDARECCSSVDGGWGSWSWESWSGACGDARRGGERTCSNPRASCGGADCEGSSEKVETTTTLNAVDGGWSGFGSWCVWVLCVCCVQR